MVDRSVHLAKAREARKDPWTLEKSLASHEAYEAERLTALLQDAQANPRTYCKRVPPLTNTQVCGKCNAIGVMVKETLDHFVVWSCPVCGSCYYPGVDPIPRSERYENMPGRHHTEAPGAHYDEYDTNYRKNLKGKKKNATT